MSAKIHPTPRPMPKTSLPFVRSGRGDIVGGHEEGAQDQAAGEQLIDGVIAAQQAEYRHGGQIGHRMVGLMTLVQIR